MTDLLREIVATRPKLMARARRLVNTRDDAEDLVQETLVRCVAAAPKFDGRSSALTWANAIMSRAFVDTLRKRGVRERAGYQVDTTTRHPETIGAALANALDALPASIGEPFRMCIEGYGGAEIASHLGTSEAAARLRIHRARLVLRAVVESEAA